MRIIKIIVTVIVCAGLVAGSLIFTLNTYMVSRVSDRIYTDFSSLSGYDCILVLGAGVNADGEPSNMLRDRLEMGMKLYDAGVSDKIIMSGDHGSADYDEVNVMKSWAIDAGADSEDIFMDHAGFSTYESLYRARDVFCAKSVVIVTQRYHLYRALYVAEALGLDAVGVPAEDISYSGQTYREIRELAARAKDWMYTIVKPKPAFLGDAIPVSGSGDLTNDQ